MLIFADQLTAYFENLLSSLLSAYRNGYNYQHVILQLTAKLLTEETL